jgi:hypothetical protein
MRDIYQVSLAGPHLFEVSALLISNLAWPGSQEAAGRERLYLSLCAWFIRDQAARDPDWAGRPQWIRPDYACRADDAIKRDVRTLERRLKDRVTAGHMAVAFLKHAETGAAPLSIIGQADAVREDRGLIEAENIPARVCRPSLPVIHLCAAWATTAQEVWNATGARLVLDQVMREPAFLAAIIRRAEIYEPLLQASSLEISPDSLIRFRVI